MLFKKKHIKLALMIVIPMIVILLIFSIFFIQTESLPGDFQTTVGNNSPAITSQNGNVTITYHDKVDEKLKKLKEANIVFDSPSKLVKNETKTLSLILSISDSINDLLSKLKTEEKESARIKVSGKMKAELIGENEDTFKIINITPSLQIISSTSPTYWKWDLTPLQSGIQYLHVSVTALISIDGKEEQYSIKTFDKEIQVEVGIVNEVNSFFINHWKWLLGSLIFPLVAWFWKIKYSKKSETNG